jgi:putative endonuclease
MKGASVENSSHPGEEAAAQFLVSQGYRVITRNYKCRAGEIDIIAEDSGVICFVEVKSRSSVAFGLPKEYVLKFKQKRISKAALAFLRRSQLLDKQSRFDVVSVVFKNGTPDFELIKHAFDSAIDF